MFYITLLPVISAERTSGITLSSFILSGGLLFQIQVISKFPFSEANRSRRIYTIPDFLY